MFQNPTKERDSGRHRNVIRFSTHNPHAENSYVFAERCPAQRPLKKILSREELPGYRQTAPLPYKDADDEYLHSSSFTRDEIPVARHLLAKAWNFILDAEVK
jgi:hypothetical protein